MHDSFQMQVSAKASFEKSSQEVALNCIAMEMFTEEGGHKQEQWNLHFKDVTGGYVCTK